MNQLKIIEHQNQRVLLTQQLAENYETDSKSISYNFNHNRDKYLEGKHYFLLQGDELKAFREFHDLPNNLNKVYLWTERGALLHAKSLNTDKAWEVYDNLVEHYFKVKTMSPMQMLKLQNAALVEVDERVTTVETDVKDLKENKLLNPGEYNHLNAQVRKRVRAIKEVRGLDLNKQQNSKLFSFINRDLNKYIGIRTRSQFKEKDFEKALNFVSEWDLGYTDLKIIEEMGD